MRPRGKEKKKDVPQRARPAMNIRGKKKKLPGPQGNGRKTANLPKRERKKEEDTGPSKKRNS